MRLIDADKLLHQGYDYIVDGIAYDSCNKSIDIENIPTVKAIPLDKVKQAKKEIENIGMYSYLEFMKEIACNDREVRMSKKFAIAVLDKLIAESED